MSSKNPDPDSGEWTNNLRKPAEPDVAGVIARWRARRAAAGQQIGSSLN